MKLGKSKRRKKTSRTNNATTRKRETSKVPNSPNTFKFSVWSRWRVTATVGAVVCLLTLAIVGRNFSLQHRSPTDEFDELDWFPLEAVEESPDVENQLSSSQPTPPKPVESFSSRSSGRQDLAGTEKNSVLNSTSLSLSPSQQSTTQQNATLPVKKTSPPSSYPKMSLKPVQHSLVLPVSHQVEERSERKGENRRVSRPVVWLLGYIEKVSD